MNPDLKKRIEDLLHQATTEKSHYYVASVLRDIIAEVERLEGWEQEWKETAYIEADEVVRLNKENARLKKAFERAKEGLVELREREPGPRGFENMIATTTLADIKKILEGE